MRFTIRSQFLAVGGLVVSLILAPALFVVLAGPSRTASLLLLLAGVALALSAGYLLTERLTRPLHEIAVAVRRMAQSLWDRPAPVRTPDGLSEMKDALDRMAADLPSRLEEKSGARARFRSILSNMREGVLVLDRDGKTVLMNAAMERVLQLDASTATGRPLIEVLRHHQINQMVAKVLESGQDRSEEVTIFMPEERIFSVQAVVSKEAPIAAVLVFHDVTELKRLERVRKDFVANVSHELKTPMTSIKGYIEALMDGAKDDPKKCSEFLGIIQKHANGLDSILSDLLQLSTIESGRHHWALEPASVPDLVQRAARVVQPLADKKKQSLSIAAAEGPCDVVGDADKLLEVLINLMDNAIKYTPEGGRIAVETKNTGPQIEIAVSDTGIGIPPKHLSRIFERFYRVDAARSREMGGTGLGLSIVRHIVEAHHGTVRVESEPGKGSRFTVSLPTATTQLF